MVYRGGEIWALDVATNTGMAQGRPGGVPWLSVHRFREHKNEPTSKLFGRATLFLAEHLRHSRPEMIAIEAPVPPSQKGGATTFATSEIALGLNGIFMGIADCRGIPVLPVHIGSWRKLFLGQGNLKGKVAKDQCLVLCKQLGWDAGDDHNAAEAAGVWFWACSQVDPRNVTRIEPLFARAVGGGDHGAA